MQLRGINIVAIQYIREFMLVGLISAAETLAKFQNLSLQTLNESVGKI